MMNKREFIASLFYHTGPPRSTTQEQWSPKCLIHWLLPQEMPAPPLGCCKHMKTHDPKKSWQHSYNRTRTTPFTVPQSPNCSFPPARNSCTELRKQQQSKQELNFWSWEHQDVMNLSDFNLCLLYPSRKRSPLSPEILLSAKSASVPFISRHYCIIK